MRISDANSETGTDLHVLAKRLRKRLNGAFAVSTAVAFCACGGGEPEAQAPIAREGPEDQILRVGATWEARWAEQGFRTPPSLISLFDTRVTSRISLVRGKKTATESLVFDGSFKLQNGASFACQARADTAVAVTFGDRAGEAAVQLSRSALRIARTCDHSGFPEPELVVPATRGRFALRGDKLVGFDPPTERREYLPAD